MNTPTNRRTKAIATKTSKAELQRRVAIIQELIAMKMRESEIIEHCVKQYPDWHIKPSTVRKYMARAKEDLVRQLKRHSGAMMAESIMDLNHLYKKALSDGDYRTALAVRKEKNQLLALYSMSEAEDSSDKGNTSADDEISDMMRDVTVSPMSLS